MAGRGPAMVFDRKNQTMTGRKSSSWNLPVIMALTGQYASNERTREPFWTSCEPTVRTATTLLSKRQEHCPWRKCACL